MATAHLPCLDRGDDLMRCEACGRHWPVPSLERDCREGRHLPTAPTEGGP